MATHDVHYLYPKDESVLNILQNRWDHQQPKAGAFYLPSLQEMKEKFRDLPDALENTIRIAQRCQFRLEIGRYRLPKFSVPENWNKENYLKHLCQEGLQKRFDFHLLSDYERQRIMERMNQELAVIISRGLASYFLIVWDIVQFARERRISIGPGRGSAAGSCGLFTWHPIEYELSFERFLSLDRPDLPDIDLESYRR